MQLPTILYQSGWNNKSTLSCFQKNMDPTIAFDRSSLRSAFEKIPYIFDPYQLNTLIDKFNEVAKEEILRNTNERISYKPDYRKTHEQVSLAAYSCLEYLPHISLFQGFLKQRLLGEHLYGGLA
jgi:hypothetical protein